jgi:hypothetical protein
MELMAIDKNALFLHVGIIAVATIGITEWLKNYIKVHLNENKGKVYGTVAFLVCMGMAFVQSSFVPPSLTKTLNLGLLGVAAFQIGHTYIIKNYEKLLDKVLKIKTEDSK